MWSIFEKLKDSVMQIVLDVLDVDEEFDGEGVFNDGVVESYYFGNLQEVYFYESDGDGDGGLVEFYVIEVCLVLCDLWFLGFNLLECFFGLLFQILMQL